MAAIHIAGFVTVFVLSLILESSADPGHHVHTKHIIHAPLHIKMIHHHKIVKVPIVFRKHLHHHKHLSQEHVYIPLKEKPKPVYEESASGSEGGDAYPVKYVKVLRPSFDQDGGDSGEGSNESQGHYYTQFGDIHGGQGYGSDRSEGYNSYEYDESQEDAGNQYHGRQ